MLFTIALMQIKSNQFHYCFKIIPLLLLSSLFQNSLCTSDKYDLELNNRNCWAVKYKNSTCKDDQVKVWNTYYNKQYFIDQQQPTINKNCLGLCQENDNCIAINVDSEGTSNNCYLLSSVSSRNLISKNNVDVIVLSCCILNSELVKSTNMKPEGPDTEKCTKWSSRIHFCSDPIWVKRSRGYSLEANGFFVNVNGQQLPECMKTCNNNRACIAFQYNIKTLECRLKYKHISMSSSSSSFQSDLILHELHCCDPLLIIPENEECLLSNTCESGTAVWTIFLKKNVFSLSSSPTVMVPLECRQNCALNKNNCGAASITKHENCKYMTDSNKIKDSTSYLTDDINSDAFVKSCCPYVDNPEIVSNVKKKKDASFKCEQLTNRYGFCANPQWIIYEKKAYSKEKLGIMKIIKVNNEDICMKQCNELIGCLAFVYKAKSQECFLRYFSSEEKDLKDSDDHTYGNLECCLVTFMPLDQICYVDNDTIKNKKCKRPGYFSTEVTDGNVKCTNKKIIRSIKVSTIDHCRKACSYQDNCLSFEVHINNNGMQTTHIDCNLNEAIDVCQVDKMVKTIRFFQACCKKMEFPDFNGKKFAPCDDEMKGKIYSGIESVSSTGQTCLNWKTVKPNISPDKFPSQENNDHSNCRNLDVTVRKPWCIVSGSYLFEMCDVHKCENIFANKANEEICTTYKKKIGCQKGFEPRWILDTNVQCSSSESLFNTTATDDELKCKELCQNSPLCYSYENSLNQADNTEYCQFKSEIDNCMVQPAPDDTTSKRWLIGCCHKFNHNDLETKSKPLRNCQSTIDKMPIFHYDGDAIISISDTECSVWGDSGSSLLKKDMFFKGDMSHNLCRNLNNDPNGPWCMISGSYYYEYCKIPPCPSLYSQTEHKKICLEREDLKEKGCAKNYEIKWIHEKITGKCQGLLKDNIADSNTTDINSCFEYCQNHKECISFEYNNVNNVTKSCSFKKTKRNCLKNTQGTVLHRRYWLGCCPKPIDIDIYNSTRPSNNEILGISRTVMFYALIPMFILIVAAIIGFFVSYFICRYYKPMAHLAENKIKERRFSNNADSLKSDAAIIKSLDEIISRQ